MAQDSLAFGLLDTSRRVGDRRVAGRLRDLTLSWSRYGYAGVVLEGASVEGILDRALRAGYRHCLVQGHGHVISEDWSPGHWGAKDFHQALAEWVAAHDFFVTGRPAGGPGGGWGLDPTCLLVNLGDYAELGRPRFDRPGESGPPGQGFLEAGRRGGKRVYHFDDALLRHSIVLYPEDAAAREQFAACLGRGIFEYRAEARPGLTAGQRRFLDGVERQARGATGGVFPWNIESYRDVAEPPEDFEGPVSTLYCVAAGLKPNKILQTHGLGDRTRVVFFDYSPQALEFRRLLLREFDGTDYPRFLRGAFERLPAPGTFFHLWSGLSPDQVDRRDLERQWESELLQWGGAEAFREHWAAYRKLPHEFVHCDLLNEPGELFARVADEDGAVVWWSNAFFTVHSNWFYPAAERARRYGDWVRVLAARCPRAALYGADHNNVSVNAVRAAAYADRFAQGGDDCLVPLKVQRCQIRS
jgi:hypothetical protein